MQTLDVARNPLWLYDAALKSRLQRHCALFSTRIGVCLCLPQRVLAFKLIAYALVSNATLSSSRCPHSILLRTRDVSSTDYRTTCLVARSSTIQSTLATASRMNAQSLSDSRFRLSSSFLLLLHMWGSALCVVIIVVLTSKIINSVK